MWNINNTLLAKYVFDRQAMLGQIVLNVSFKRIQIVCARLEARHGRNAGLPVNFAQLPTLETLRGTDALRLI